MSRRILRYEGLTPIWSDNVPSRARLAGSHNGGLIYVGELVTGESEADRLRRIRHDYKQRKKAER